MRDILSGVLPTGYGKVNDLKRVGDTNFLYGGLNIVYGVDGSGKSYQTAASFSPEEDVVYLDCDGSNGLIFVQHCHKHGVHYVNQDTVQSRTKGKDLLGKLMLLIQEIVLHNRETNIDFKPVFIVDSLTSIGEGREINNAEKISPILYLMNNHAEKYNYCLILIDHATEQYDKGKSLGFKLEGNSSAKRRASVTVNRYTVLNSSNPSQGGMFKCERARGNADGLSIGDEFTVSKMSSKLALDWVTKRQPSWLEKPLSKTDLNKATKNDKDKWIRQYVLDLFDEYSEGKKTMYVRKNR